MFSSMYQITWIERKLPDHTLKASKASRRGIFFQQRQFNSPVCFHLARRTEAVISGVSWPSLVPPLRKTSRTPFTSLSLTRTAFTSFAPPCSHRFLAAISCGCDCDHPTSKTMVVRRTPSTPRNRSGLKTKLRSTARLQKGS